MPLRQHDVVLAEGHFKIVLTDRHRLFAVIDAPQTALGPLRVAFEIDRRPQLQALHLRHQLEGREHVVGGIFDDIGHAFSNAAKGVAHGIEHAAEGAFNAASKVATTIARPAFNTVRDVASAGMHLIAQHAPFLPASARKQIESASRIVMRARLGDLTAKQFVHGVVSAVKAGVQGARAIGDALLTGGRLVSHVLDTPFKLAEHIPGIGGLIHQISPFQKFEKMTTALQRGDFRALKKIVTDDVRLAQGVVSLVPGIGTGISSGLSAGMAVLDGGSPLEVAIHAAYGAIPIPPGLRNITDAVLESVLALAVRGSSITDAAIAAARDAVPSGLPRDVFDTLVHLVVKKHPIQQAGTALVDHYVKQFTSAGLPSLPELEHDLMEVLQSAGRLVQPLSRLVEAGDLATPPFVPSPNIVLP